MTVLSALAIFTPDQWAMIAGFALAGPFAQYFATEYSKYLAANPRVKEALNWALSILVPALGTLATVLATNPKIALAFPIFTSLYALGQGVYLASVRFVRRAKQYQRLYEEAAAPAQL